MGCEISRDDDPAELDDHVVVGRFGLRGVPTGPLDGPPLLPRSRTQAGRVRWAV